MSSGQSLRNGSSVEPGLPNTFLMPNARSRSRVACLTVTEAGLIGVRDNAVTSNRHCEEPPGPAFGGPDDKLRDEAIQCSKRSPGLLRFARNDGEPHHVAVPFIVGCPAEFAVHTSMPAAVSLALMLNSLPSNKGCSPR